MKKEEFLKNLTIGSVIEIPNTAGLIGTVVDWSVHNNVIKFTTITSKEEIYICTGNFDCGWIVEAYDAKGIAKHMQEKIEFPDNEMIRNIASYLGITTKENLLKYLNSINKNVLIYYYSNGDKYIRANSLLKLLAQ